MSQLHRISGTATTAPKADIVFVHGLGGDAFGYHWIDDDHFAMYLLDVCDHGVGSALLSVAALNVLKTQSLTDVDFREPDQVLTQLNQKFPMHQHNNLYFTIWYGVYNRRNRTIKHASGGHPPSFLLSADGSAAEYHVKEASPRPAYAPGKRRTA